MTPPADDTIVRQVDDLVASWHDLRERHARATTALERALEDEHQLGVSEFEVLERLALADESTCRMQALHATVHLSQSALSRVVGRLESAGLTPDGRARYEDARPTHRRVLGEVLGA